MPTRLTYRSAKLRVFETAARLLPRRAKDRVGRSKVLRPFRNLFFRPGGSPELAECEIRFENLRFYFSAPYQTLAHARSTGIESRICRLIMSEAKPGAVCIDVGANYGFISLVCALAAGPEGRVLAVEADWAVHRGLVANLEANSLTAIVTAYLGAAGSSDGPGPAGVPGLRLDDIVETNRLQRLDVVKIDTDGADYDVLLGARSSLQRFRPLLIVELCENRDEILSLVRQLGYKHLFDMNGNPVEPGSFPPNLIAASHPVTIPTRGSLSAR